MTVRKNSPLKDKIMVYMSESNFQWVRENAFKHATKASYFINAVIEAARKREPIDFSHHEYKKNLYLK